jgi:hypothetical protein
MNPEYVMFIGLNPSTADEILDDPTVRRCIGYAKLWGYGALCMTNLFAFRATNPRIMKSQKNPIGTMNDKFLIECDREASIVIAAWGVHGAFLARDEHVCKLLDNLYCLGITKEGYPKHPLYLSRDARPIAYVRATS